MTPEQQRIAIAKACGWAFINQVDKYPHGLPPDDRKDRYTSPLPDYPTDLNAMHEAAMAQPPDVRSKINDQLIRMMPATEPYQLDKTVNATALQRAEAFLRTLNLWVE